MSIMFIDVYRVHLDRCVHRCKYVRRQLLFLSCRTECHTNKLYVTT